MWKKFVKSKGKSPGRRTWSDEEMKIVGWCLTNNIFISCSPDFNESGHDWIIDIKIKNNIHQDPVRYEDETVLNKIYEYYKYYYDKYRK